jgi:hypothetical protein
MKIISLINETYTHIAHNFYLQLQKFNFHNELIIYCDSAKTLDKIKNLNLDCESYVYKPLLPNRWLYLLDQDIPSTIVDGIPQPSHEAWGHPKWTLLQIIKHDIVYKYLKDNPTQNVLLMDMDMVVFRNFLPEINYLIESNKNWNNIPVKFLTKHYLNVNKDFSKFGASQFSGMCKSIINTGFIGFVNSKETRDHIKNFYQNMTQLNLTNKCDGEISCQNVDELIITKYVEDYIVQCREIPDQINMLSDIGHIYNSLDIMNIKPATYHVTFALDTKVNFIKSCEAWLL